MSLSNGDEACAADDVAKDEVPLLPQHAEMLHHSHSQPHKHPAMSNVDLEAGSKRKVKALAIIGELDLKSCINF